MHSISHLRISTEISMNHTSSNLILPYSSTPGEYRTPDKKKGSWSRLDFILKNGCVLHEFQYNDSQIYYFLYISACISYCSFSYLVLCTAVVRTPSDASTEYFDELFSKPPFSWCVPPCPLRRIWEIMAGHTILRLSENCTAVAGISPAMAS